MSKTAIVFLAVYLSATAAAFIVPQVGVWGFLFESNFHPPLNWWGGTLQQYGERWSFFIGAAMVFAVLLHWGRFTDIKVFSHPQTILFGLYVANAFLVTQFWNYEPAYAASLDESVDILKWFAVYICIIKTHSDRRWLPILLIIYIFACYKFGYDSTFDPRGGRSVRGGTTTTDGENFLSPQVIAFMPLVCFYMTSPSTRMWLRCSCLIGLPLMLNVVAHGSSRGAFLTLCAAAASMLIFARGRLRTITAVMLIIGSLFAMRLFHEQFWQRMSSINVSESSAVGRIDAWKAAWALAQQNPFGYGAEAFDRGLGAELMPEEFHTTHNTFFELLIAWGCQGTCFFFGFVLITMRDLWQWFQRLYQSSVWPPRESVEALGVFVGLISMLVASCFLNRMRWELWWVFGAYAVCMNNIYANLPPEAAVDSEQMLSNSTTSLLSPERRLYD